MEPAAIEAEIEEAGELEEDQHQDFAVPPFLAGEEGERRTE